MNKQYIVQSYIIDERKFFYDYLIDNDYSPVENFKHIDFINNKFPFVIEPNKTFWICQSITCCAAASQCGAIITIEDYFTIAKNNNYQLIINPKNSKTKSP